MLDAKNEAEKSNDHAPSPMIVFFNPKLHLSVQSEQKLRSAGIRYVCLSSMLDVTDMLSRAPDEDGFIATIIEDLAELDRFIGHIDSGVVARYVIILGPTDDGTAKLVDYCKNMEIKLK